MRSDPSTTKNDIEMTASNQTGSAVLTQDAPEAAAGLHMLPLSKTITKRNHMGYKVTKGIKPEGESGRKGVHPIQFLRICWRSTSNVSKLVNILFPVVPAAIAIRYARPDLSLTIFILNYIAMVPCANLVGFAGSELARKLPTVFGILMEITLGSIVEIILFMVLLTK